MKAPSEPLYLTDQRNTKPSHSHLHLWSTMPWCGCLSAPCHTYPISFMYLHCPPASSLHCPPEVWLPSKDYTYLWDVWFARAVWKPCQNVLLILSVLSSVFGRMYQCPPPLHFLLRVVLYGTSFFIHSLYLIGLVLSMSFSFSLTFSSLIKVNSDKHSGSTLEAIAFLDMLAWRRHTYLWACYWKVSLPLPNAVNDILLSLNSRQNSL